MSFGPSAIEKEAQAYRKDFGASLPQYMNQGMGWMNQGFQQLEGVNGEIRNYISGLGKDSFSMNMQNYLGDIMSGKLKAAQGQAFSGTAAQSGLSQGKTFDLAMKGNTFAQQFGSDLGGLALQQKNMSTIADKLASTDQNPFAVLNKQALEDAAFQNMQGKEQLRSQLAAQGLDSTSGTGAAALAALQFNTNKHVADQARQAAVQGAQFQQQGMGMAAGIYNQAGTLDLQRATTASQLGLQGYQADMQNAARYDQMSQANAQMANQVGMSNAQLATQASLANAQNATQASLQNAGYQNALQQAGMQGGLAMMQNNAQNAASLYGLLSQNSGQYLNAGQNMWNSSFTAQQNYMNMMNQAAQASAAGRGQMMGGLLQGAMGLAGAAMGNPTGILQIFNGISSAMNAGKGGGQWGAGYADRNFSTPGLTMGDIALSNGSAYVQIPMTQPTMSYTVPGASPTFGNPGFTSSYNGFNPLASVGGGGNFSVIGNQAWPMAYQPNTWNFGTTMPRPGGN